MRQLINYTAFLLGLLLPLLCIPQFAHATNWACINVKTWYNLGDGGVAYIDLDNPGYTGTCTNCSPTGWLSMSYSTPSKVAWREQNGDYLQYGVGTSTFHTTGTCADYWPDAPEYPNDSITEPLPSEPAACSNGEHDEGEEGIDCGGVCSTDCTPFCPTSSVTEDNGDGTYSCVEIVSLDDYGNCPKGTSYVQGDTELGGDTPDACIKTTDPILGPIDYNPSFDDYEEPWESGSYIIVENAYEPTVVDNGDGTSTETIVVDRDLQDSSGTSTGSTSTSTTTNVINNSTGAVISSVTTTSGTTDPTEDPTNYDWSMPDGFGDDPGGDLINDAPEEKSIKALYNSFIISNPVTTLFADTEITTADSVCSMTWNYKGTDVEFSLCGDPYESTFTYMGNILVFICTITGYFIIFGRK